MWGVEKRNEIEVTLRDRKMITNRPQSGVRYGTLCDRGQPVPEIVYSPDRMNKCLIRANIRKNLYDMEFVDHRTAGG